MTLYYITVGNIYNEETESTRNYDNLDAAHDEAADIAQEMLSELKESYKGVETYYPEQMTIEDDITYKEEVLDAYEYHNHYE